MNDAGPFTDEDRAFMAEAITLAGRGLYTTNPNPRVGCVIVRDGHAVGRGWHERAGGPHAEVHALAEAGAQARGATVYVSLEPCAHHGRTGPCADVLIEAGVAALVAAHEDPNPQVAGAGLARLAAAGIKTRSGLLADRARSLNRGFLKRMAGGGPWVRLKSAMSLDGRTALADGVSQWITGPGAREDVHRLRARSACIVTGIGTVLADDPRLSARIAGVHVEPALCVLLDSALRCPLDARVLGHPGGCLIFAVKGSADPARALALTAAGADVIELPPAAVGVELKAVLAHLATREMNEVMVEAGAELAGAFLAGRLVDEWVVYLAPHLLGDQGKALANIGKVRDMGARMSFAWHDVRRVGDDVRLTLYPAAVNGP